MLTHDEIREELIRQLDAGEIKAVTVARKLNIAAARVSEMRKRDRRVQQDEMQPLAELLKMTPASPTNVRPVEATEEIANWGKVAQGVWLEQTDRDEFETVPYDRFAGDPGVEDLFAVTPEGTSMNLVFLPGTDLICRRTAFGDGRWKTGDYVIAQRTAHDLRELTCKRVEIDDDGEFWLHSESSDPKFAEPWKIGKPTEDHHLDSEIQIVGKVIRAVQNFERRR